MLQLATRLFQHPIVLFCRCNLLRVCGRYLHCVCVVSTSPSAILSLQLTFPASFFEVMELVSTSHSAILSLQPFVSALLCGLPVLRHKAVRALHRPPLLTALREVKTPNNKGDTAKYKCFGENQVGVRLGFQQVMHRRVFLLILELCRQSFSWLVLPVRHAHLFCLSPVPRFMQFSSSLLLV